jgi:predicted ATP-dependent serine protease
MVENSNPILAITAEIESSHESGTDIGMFTIKSANRTITDAALRPNPRSLYLEFWYEGEVCCLFSDSNLGKSIYAVQMADQIATTRRVLLVDCELTDKQFQMRYTDSDTGLIHIFPEGLFRAEINPVTLDVNDYEEKIIKNIEAVALRMQTSIIIIDNLTYLCNSSDKGVDAGLFMMKLMNLKKKYGWSLLIIAHTPKRNLSSPITQNDLAGSKKLYNFFDSVFAIGKSAKDDRLRYVKQLKVRAGEFLYDSNNIIVYEIEKSSAFVHFEFKEYSTEKEHLRERTESDDKKQLKHIKELKAQGKSVREIASLVGLSKSKVWRLLQTQTDEEAPETTQEPTPVP